MISKENKLGWMTILDIFMIILVIVNLIWLAADWFFTSPMIQNYLSSHLPGIFSYYKNQIHSNFLFYDGIFVTIFIVEFLFRWFVSIIKRTHYKWFFYPFLNWYDIVGCIPLGSFRFLRLFRVFSLGFRLQSQGVINFKKHPIYKMGKKYYDIILEEISDRVVVNVLEGIQEEVKRGNPLSQKMISEIIEPHKTQLSSWISNKIKKSTSKHYGVYKNEIKDYLAEKVNEAMKSNSEIRDLRKIPVFGSQIVNSLQSAIADVTFGVINGVIEDLGSSESNDTIKEVVEIIFDAALVDEKDENLNRIVNQIVYDSLNAIKDQAKVQQWKIREQQEKLIKKRAKQIFK